MLTQYPHTPEEERLGGIMQAGFRLVQAIARSEFPNFQLCVITESESVRAMETLRLSDSVEVRFYPKRRTLVNVLSFEYLNALAILKENVRSFNPDLLHVQGKVNYLLAGQFVRGVPCVSTIHGIFKNEMKVVNSKPGIRGFFVKHLKTALESIYCRRMKYLIAITDEVSAFVKLKSKDVEVFRINNAIDNSFFSVRPISTQTEKRILFVAAITYRKGLDFLLKAMVRVAEEFPDAKLRIAGIWDWDPLYVKSLQTEYATYINTGAITFLGGITQEQLLHEMQESLLFCLPSRAESAPMVIAQALAAGRPVIASNVGGIPAMVTDGVTGHLWNVGDVGSLEKLICTVLSDRELAKQMGVRSRQESSARYSGEGIAIATVNAYRHVLQSEIV